MPRITDIMIPGIIFMETDTWMRPHEG